jgi:soluble lytic murein transglycosylase-like protein
LSLTQVLLLILLMLMPSVAPAVPMVSSPPPPRIGKLLLPPEYWGYVLEAAKKYRVSPYKIAGVMAIESGYDPHARSGRTKSGAYRCIGLMQLDRGVARALGVNPADPRENIMGGAQVLARLLKKHHGSLPAAIREYNGTGDKAYLREVLKAIRQAERRAP